MIRRLFVLLLVSIIVVGGSASFRPAQSASSDPCKQDHAAWLTRVLEKMESMKPGMTRWDLLHVFRTEEGVRTRREVGLTGLRETFVSQDCPNFKIDVEFKSVRFDLPNQDVIAKVSKPYVNLLLRIRRSTGRSTTQEQCRSNQHC